MKRSSFFLLLFALCFSTALFAGNCAFCHRSTDNLNEYLTDGKNVFCSERCAGKWHERNAPKCSVCGKPVQNGFQSGNKFFCSNACVNAFEMRNAKKCSTCGKKSLSGVTSKGKNYCSEECYLKSLPVCSSCRQPVKEGLIFEGNVVFCKKCAARERCAVCNLPSEKLSVQQDGRKICAKCLSTGIFSESEALREFNRVRLDLGRYFNLQIDDRVTFHLCGLDEIAAKMGTYNTQEFGLCCYQVSSIMRGNVEVNTMVKREIFILYGLPLNFFRSIVAHELAHDWFNCNVGANPPLKVGEGWAQFVAWNYCKKIGDTEQMQVIEKNTTPGYGDGFRMMKRRLNISAGPEKLQRQLYDMTR